VVKGRIRGVFISGLWLCPFWPENDHFQQNLVRIWSFSGRKGHLLVIFPTHSASKGLRCGWPKCSVPVGETFENSGRDPPIIRPHLSRSRKNRFCGKKEGCARTLRVESLGKGVLKNVERCGARIAAWAYAVGWYRAVEKDLSHAGQGSPVLPPPCRNWWILAPK
jgi:hypothetical protein